MAADPQTRIAFQGRCPDCGVRSVALPQALPAVGDDFDWDVRDYDGFRLFLLQELAARFPERSRWTPADLEVALAEVLAFVLDQLSDTLDRVAAEATLETARRPSSVRRLLRMIGYDALALARAHEEGPFDPSGQSPDDLRSDSERFDAFWLDHPEAMEQARLAGPRSLRTQRRAVTLDDHEHALEAHPLVVRAKAQAHWGGAWPVVRIALIPGLRRGLDESGSAYPEPLASAITGFHREHDLPLPPLSGGPSMRALLAPYVEAYRIVGQEVVLVEAKSVGVLIALSARVRSGFFRSELAHAVERALGTGPEGFFAPGRLRFGEDLYAGDLYQRLMALDGVENVCLNRFKRVGDRFPDRSADGRIVLSDLEVAVCDNDPAAPQRGYLHLAFEGGRRG
jgi:hypothetical protein